MDNFEFTDGKFVLTGNSTYNGKNYEDYLMKRIKQVFSELAMNANLEFSTRKTKVFSLEKFKAAKTDYKEFLCFKFIEKRLQNYHKLENIINQKYKFMDKISDPDQAESDHLKNEFYQDNIFPLETERKLIEAAVSELDTFEKKVIHLRYLSNKKYTYSYISSQLSKEGIICKQGGYSENTIRKYCDIALLKIHLKLAD